MRASAWWDDWPDPTVPSPLCEPGVKNACECQPQNNPTSNSNSPPSTAALLFDMLCPATSSPCAVTTERKVDDHPAVIESEYRDAYVCQSICQSEASSAGSFPLYGHRKEQLMRLPCEGPASRSTDIFWPIVDLLWLFTRTGHCPSAGYRHQSRVRSFDQMLSLWHLPWLKAPLRVSDVR